MTRAVGAEVAHFPDTEGVTSSNLVSPTGAMLHINQYRVIGAAASALPSHGRGHRFDSYITHRCFVPVLPGFCLSLVILLILRSSLHDCVVHSDGLNSLSIMIPIIDNRNVRKPDENTKKQMSETQFLISTFIK